MPSNEQAVNRLLEKIENRYCHEGIKRNWVYSNVVPYAKREDEASLSAKRYNLIKEGMTIEDVVRATIEKCGLEEAGKVADDMSKKYDRSPQGQGHNKQFRPNYDLTPPQMTQNNYTT